MSETVQLEPGKRVQYYDAVIAAGGSQSSVINLYGYVLKGVLMPALFTGTAMTFFMSDKEDGPYVPVHEDNGTQLSITVAPNRYVAISTIAHAEGVSGINFLKVASGSIEGSARQLKIVGGVSTK